MPLMSRGVRFARGESEEVDKKHLRVEAKKPAEVKPVYLLVCGLLALLHGFIMITSVPHVFQTMAWWSNPHVPMVLVESIISGICAYLVWANLAGKLGIAWTTDLTLLAQSLIPYANLSWHFALSTFDATQR